MSKTATIARLVANLEMNSASFRKEMDDARARTQKFTRDLKSTSAANDAFGRSMRGAAQGVASIDGPLGGVSGRLGAMTSLLTGSAAGWALLGAGVAGVTAVLYKSIRAGEEMERGMLKIDAILKATGSASGRTSDQLDEQARAVARNTLASISGIRDAQGVLLTFKTVQTDVFDKAIVLSQDLAAVMGGDAKSAAMQLGKALEDPATGLTALKRSGVSFTESEKELIKTMQASGRTAEAQRMILLKLEQQVGGAGAAEGAGLSGAVDLLGQEWQEFLEGLSKTSGSTSIATKAINGLAGVIATLRRGIAPTETESLKAEFNELSHSYQEAKERLERLQQGHVDKNDGRNITRLREQMAKYQARMDEIQNANKKTEEARTADDLRAAQAAADARAQVEAERLARELVMQQEAGAAQLIQLDEFLANKRGKLVLEHQERLRQIETLQLSEQELARRGYEALDLLKAEYKARENERYQLALEEETAKAQERENRQLERERDLQEQITKIQQEQLAKRKKAEEDLAAAKVAIAQNLLGLGIAAAKEGSKAQRALLVVQKAIALRTSLMNLQVAITEASKLTWPANIPAIAQATTIGLGAISSIKSVDTNVSGIAHGGLDYVPAESTYLLDKGERVLSPNQNADLTAALKSGGLGARVTVNLVEDASRGGQVEQSKGLNGEDVIRIFVADIRNGGDSATVLENTYGVARNGTL